MFQDIGVSKDLNENFKRHLTNSGEPLDIDFSIQVLLLKSAEQDLSWSWFQNLSTNMCSRFCHREVGHSSSPAFSPSPQNLSAASTGEPQVKSFALLTLTVQVHSLLRRSAQWEKVELAVPHEQGRAGHQLLQEQVKLTIYCPDLKADSSLAGTRCRLRLSRCPCCSRSTRLTRGPSPSWPRLLRSRWIYSSRC